MLNRESGRRVQRVLTAQALASEAWQRWLRAENAQGADIYISQNALRENTRNRKKEDIGAIRHVYLDLDQDGAKSLGMIENSTKVPRPSYVITSSPGKFQVIWKVKEMTQDQAESLQRRMVQEFGADPAATDSSRVLRLPGFVNKKYAEPFHVVAEAQSRETYRFQDFKLSRTASEHQAAAPAGTSGRPSSLAARTQSERDWKWAVRHVQQGEPLSLDHFERIDSNLGSGHADPRRSASGLVDDSESVLFNCNPYPEWWGAQTHHARTISLHPTSGVSRDDNYYAGDSLGPWLNGRARSGVQLFGRNSMAAATRGRLSNRKSLLLF